MTQEVTNYQGFKETGKFSFLNKTRIAAGMVVGFGLYVHGATLYEGVSDNNWDALPGSGTFGLVLETTGSALILNDIVRNRNKQALLHITAELKERNEYLQDFLDSLSTPQQVETGVITLQPDEYHVISDDLQKEDSTK